MRVLYTVSGPAGSGSFDVAYSLAKELHSLGHKPCIFFPDQKENINNQHSYEDYYNMFRIWEFPIGRGKSQIETFPLLISDPHPKNPYGITFSQLTPEQFAFYLEELEAILKKIIEDFKPDIIENQHIWLISYVLKKIGYHNICTAHHIDQIAFTRDERIKDYVKEGLKATKYIFAISNMVKDEVATLYGFEKSKIIVIPNAYNKEIFKPKEVSRKVFFNKIGVSIPEGALIISFCGKISKTKGIDILLKANKLLPKEKNIHFLLLGAGTFDKVLNNGEEKECSFERVHLLGHRSHEIVAEVHNISKLSVLPSRSEGFGISILESMACGTPVISTDVGGASEFVVGKVIGSNDPISLATSIIQLLELSDKEYAILCKQALQKAKEFSWKKSLEKRMEYYKVL